MLVGGARQRAAPAHRHLTALASERAEAPSDRLKQFVVGGSHDLLMELDIELKELCPRGTTSLPQQQLRKRLTLVLACTFGSELGRQWLKRQPHFKETPHRQIRELQSEPKRLKELGNGER